MDRKTAGRLGEVKVLAHLISEGYEVYNPFSDGAKFDFIAYKDGKLETVSVKYTSSVAPNGKWKVTLRQGSQTKDRFVHRPFDAEAFTLLAVYIGPEDRVVLLDTSQFSAKNELRVS